MHIPEALAVLRSLNLPAGRRQYLARLIVDASTDADRARVVQGARGEARWSEEAVRAAYAAEYEKRQDWASRNPHRRATGVEAGRVGSGNYGEKISFPEVRPVVISWTTPRRPEVVREERRPEQSDGFEQTRADKENAQRKRAPKGTVPHGTTSKYVSGCRCEPCREANNKYARERRARRKHEN